MQRYSEGMEIRLRLVQRSLDENTFNQLRGDIDLKV